MGYKGKFGSAGEKEYDREDPFVKPSGRGENHRDECAFLNSPPTEGDEASLCNCGADEASYQKWLEMQGISKDQSKP